MMPQDFTWTAPSDSLCFRPDILGHVDAIEIAGCSDDGSDVERVEFGGDFWSVYLHDPQSGADCIADRNTPQEAIDYASALGFGLRVPVYIFGRAE